MQDNKTREKRRQATLDGGCWRVLCPFCGKPHRHGRVEGSRLAHCRLGTYIVEAPPTPEQMAALRAHRAGLARWLRKQRREALLAERERVAEELAAREENRPSAG